MSLSRVIWAHENYFSWETIFHNWQKRKPHQTLWLPISLTKCLQNDLWMLIIYKKTQYHSYRKTYQEILYLDHSRIIFLHVRNYFPFYRFILFRWKWAFFTGCAKWSKCLTFLIYQQINCCFIKKDFGK